MRDTCVVDRERRGGGGYQSTHNTFPPFMFSFSIRHTPPPARKCKPKKIKLEEPGFKESMSLLWNKRLHTKSSRLTWFNVTLSRVHAVFEHVMGGESSAFTQIMIKDLIPVQYYSIAGQEPQHGFGIFIASSSKNSDLGVALNYPVLVRNEDAGICPIGCLAFYFHSVWTVNFFFRFISLSTHFLLSHWE